MNEVLKKKLKKFFWLAKNATIMIKKLTSTSAINKIQTEHLLNQSRPKTLSIIVFTKDRPLQLLALLKTMREHTRPFIKPTIIYHASNNRYEKAYQELFNTYQDLLENAQSDIGEGFKVTLKKVLDSFNSEYVTFFVDDIFFKESLEWKTILGFESDKVIPSLRMSPGLKRCYTLNTLQPLPPLKANGVFHLWNYSEGLHDWNYPLSVDGNIFSTKEFRDLIDLIQFKAPNTMELNLQKFQNKFKRRFGLCFDDSIIVNNPINIVQSEFFNLHGNVHQDELLSIWENGLEIDYSSYYGIKNISCHQVIEIKYKART